MYEYVCGTIVHVWQAQYSKHAINLLTLAGEATVYVWWQGAVANRPFWIPFCDMLIVLWIETWRGLTL